MYWMFTSISKIPASGAISSIGFEEVGQDQSDFIANYEAVENAENKVKLREVRFQMQSILRKTVAEITVHNGETINPWEVLDNISSKLRTLLNERGLTDQTEIEKYFEKPYGKRQFNHSERSFAVRFKNGAVRIVHPFENVSYKSLSEKLAKLAHP